MAKRTANLLGGLGRALITLGVLIVLFAVFQLYGTGLAEQQAQDDLGDSFAERRAALQATSTTVDDPPADPGSDTEPGTGRDPGAPAGSDSGGGDGAAPTTTVGPVATVPEAEPTTTTSPPVPVVAPELEAALRPDLGDTVGRIEIPAIDVDKYVISGVRRGDLRKAPGHYPDSPLPGQAGNAAIAGHRTTYGAPFGDLDRLQPGDLITVETLQGTFHYEVMGHPGADGGEVGHFIVDPYEGVSVLDDFGDNRLTLTACHPRYSARQRIVVTALLTTAPAPAPPPGQPEVAAPAPDDGTDPDADADEAADVDTGAGPAADADAGAGAGADTGAGPANDAADADDQGRALATEDPLGETLGWNTAETAPTLGWALVTAAAAAAVALAGRAWRRWPARLLGAPVVAAALFVTFTHLDRLLPAL